MPGCKRVYSKIRDHPVGALFPQKIQGLLDRRDSDDLEACPT